MNEKEIRAKYRARQCENQMEFDRIMSEMNTEQAQRVDYTEGQEPAVPSGDDNSQTGGGGTTGGELEG